MGIGPDTRIPIILTAMGTTQVIRRMILTMILTILLPILPPIHRRLGGIGTTRALILRRTVILSRPV